jgi:hypothetical protein
LDVRKEEQYKQENRDPHLFFPFPCSSFVKKGKERKRKKIQKEKENVLANKFN